MNSIIIGLGFVGLTSALGLAEAGHKVIGVEQDAKKLKLLQSGEIPFFEPELADKLGQHKDKHFFLAPTIDEALNLCSPDIVMICVGTPSQQDGAVDLSYVISAVQQTCDALGKQACTICIKSTVPPSSARDVLQPLLDGYDNLRLTNNPEFLREGYAWQDFMQPDRIVIGSDCSQALNTLERLYRSFSSPIHKVSLTEAEFIKYLSNTLLATLISFANEQSQIADTVGDINIQKVFTILHEDKRWHDSSGTKKTVNMASYVYPGCGFGGYCLPKDLQALINQAEKQGFTPNLLKQVNEVNIGMIDYHAQKIIHHTKQDDKIAILGLAFKPNSDDVRDTPAHKIIAALLNGDRKNIQCYDPEAMTTFTEHYDFPIAYKPSLEECVTDADVIVICTAWQEFTHLEDLASFTKIKQQDKFFDLRYFLAT